MQPERHPRRALWRAGAAALLVAYAGAALGSGLDRLAAGTLTGALPLGPFAAHSHTVRAFVALRSGDYSQAQQAARESVASEPVEPLNAGLLGGALLGSGEAQAADRAFRVAGRMGWREPFTQAYWMQVAIAAGDWDIAAQRADAILRANPSQAANPQIVGPFERAPEGRAALLERMRESPPWIETFFAPPAESPEESLAARAELLAKLGEERQLSCEMVAPLANRLSSAGQVGRAHAAWRAHCQPGSRALLNDPRFESLGAGGVVPFSWQLVPSGSLRVAGREEGLEITNDTVFPRTFARQLLVLAPGSYVLRWREEVGGTSPRVVPQVGCQPDRGRRLEAEPRGRGKFAARFAAGDCEGTWLTLSARPGRTALSGLSLEAD